jgi:thioredoxin reductase
MHDLIIIGGGPAGLTATIYALRKRLNVLLITKDLGGKTNYRLQLPEVDHHLVINGEEVVSRFMNEIEYLDFARVLDTVDKIERVADGYAVYVRRDQVFTARALILATGARARKLNVPGERDFWMRGLCYSAVSYAPLFVDRTVAVIGDTGLAVRAAAELARTAKHVVLIAPTPGDFDNPLGHRLRAAANVTILEGYRVERVNGPNYARSMTLAKDGAHHEVVAEAFFVELGLIPNSDLVAGQVELDAEGRVKVDARNRTSAPGLFAAGDVTDAYAEQVLIAIGEGAKAALSAYEYLLSLPVLEAESVLPEEWR